MITQRLPRLLRRPLRHGWRHLFGHPMRVVYHDQYAMAVPGVPVDPLRAERIAAFLASEGVIARSAVDRPEPVWLKALARSHDDAYLESLHEQQVMTSIFGSELAPAQIDRLIDLARLQTGGTLMAMRRARRHGVAVNLGGGFHHAHADHGAGFCIFNDVATAIVDERRRGFDGRVLVVDLDLHDGDGTRDFFRNDASVHTFSIHARHWGPIEAEESTAIELGAKVDDKRYLTALEAELPPVVARFKPRLIVYLAGCDVAIDDQLGDWRLTSDGVLARDRLVANLARTGKPIALCVLLAGGYSRNAWRYSARFLANLGDIGAIEPPSTEDMTLKRYRYISSLFDSVELSGGRTDNDFGITEADLQPPGWGLIKETRLLGFYTRHGIELVLERAGLLDRVRDLGYSHPVIELQLDEPAGHTVRIYGDRQREIVLVELRMRRDRRSIEDLELLAVEWLLLQNPGADFADQMPLPGQEHPGLGMVADVISLLVVACERLRLDGLVMVPSAYHVAALGRSHMRFLNSQTQAWFQALQKFFGDLPTAEATRAVAEGLIVDDSTGEVIRWRPEPMVLPVSARMHGLMEKAEALTAEQHRFRWR